MKTLPAVMAAAWCAFSALPAGAACASAAHERSLPAAAAPNGALENCVLDECAALALDLQLADAAKSRFLRQCMAEGLRPGDATQAMPSAPAGAGKSGLPAKCQSIEECGDLSTELEATAAGLGGDLSANSGHSFVRVKRISE